MVLLPGIPSIAPKYNPSPVMDSCTSIMSLVEAVGGEPFSLTVGFMSVDLIAVGATESVNHFATVFHHLT